MRKLLLIAAAALAVTSCADNNKHKVYDINGTKVYQGNDGFWYWYILYNGQQQWVQGYAPAQSELRTATVDEEVTPPTEEETSPATTEEESTATEEETTSEETTESTSSAGADEDE